MENTERPLYVIEFETKREEETLFYYDTILESYAKNKKIKTMRWLCLLLLLIGAGSLVLRLINGERLSLSGDGWQWHDALYILIGATGFLKLMPALLKKRARRLAEKTAESDKREDGRHVSISLYENRLRSHSDAMENTVGYDKISRFCVKNEQIRIITETRLTFLVPLRAVPEGDREEILAFLNEKLARAEH